MGMFRSIFQKSKPCQLRMLIAGFRSRMLSGELSCKNYSFIRSGIRFIFERNNSPGLHHVM